MPSYNFAPVILDAGMETVAIFLLIMLGVYALLFGLMILSYVLQSLGMYTIAKRRGIRKPWLAWLPVGNMWILGSISDQYRYVAKGRLKNKRKILMGSMIVIYALVIPLYVAYFAMMIQGIIAENYITDITDLGFAMPYLAVIAVVFIAMLVIALIAGVIEYIALYDLYASSDPYNAVTYLVLSIFVNVTMPFFLFACRKKDLGMPPRKEDIPAPQIMEAEGISLEEAVMTEEPAEKEEAPEE